MPVEFTLVYRGPLHAKSGNAGERQDIRDQLHPQLAFLLAKQWEFGGDLVTRENLPKAFLKGGEVDIRRPIEDTPYYIWEVGGYQFVPLVTSVHALACELDILWLKREAPGTILQSGGDLDNRLKSLIDGLRMPMSEAELGGRTPNQNDRRRYVLLDDDRRITRFHVDTRELLELPKPGDRPSGVELIINVRVYSAESLNMNLLFQGR